MGGKHKDSTMKVGRTIAQEWERQESESERLANRKKAKNKKIIKVLSVFAIIAIITIIVVMQINSAVINREKAEKEKPVITPTVPIIDDANMGITKRMKEYVGSFEQDLKDLGYNVSRAVVPAGKSREVDIFLEGKEYYFKLNIDRVSAVSAEDTMRMIKYLDENNLNPAEYVDIRVKGKAYYK